MKKEVIADCELYLGDCLEILPQLGVVDAIITDPPYGIKWNGRAYKDGIEWDNAIPSKEVFDLLFSISRNQIIWGLNYFIEYLKNSRCVFVWRKKMGKAPSFSQFELAWTSFHFPSVIFEYEAPGARGWWNNPRDSVRYHTAQKPLPLMEKCVSYFSDSAVIVDPFMGSGTTGVARVETGRRFIGIEINERYFEIACRRIREAAG